MNEQAAQWIFSTSRQNRAKVVAHLLKLKGTDAPFTKSIGAVQSFQILQQGWCNIVLAAECSSGNWIIRIRPNTSEGTLSEQLQKEFFLLKQLSNRVPVPGLPDLPIGTLNFPALQQSASYLIQEYVIGAHPPKDLRGQDREKLFIRLGETAQQLHSLSVDGFGNSFSHKERKFDSPSWHTFMSPQLDAYQTLLHQTEFAEQSLHIESALEKMRVGNNYQSSPQLYHHDFVSNWGNVILHDCGDIAAIIDWETAGSGPAFAKEASSLLYTSIRDNRPTYEIIKDFEHYLTGYGLTWNECIDLHLTTLHGLLAEEGLKALYTYVQHKEHGTLFRQPWRRSFAKRALCMLEWLHLGHFNDLRRWAA